MNKLLLIIIIMIATIGQIAIDIFLPSIPYIASYFSTSVQTVELMISYYTAGFSLGTLFWGALSDAFGRKNLVIIGLIFSSITCVVCVFAPTINTLLLMRFIQGLFLSAGMTIARTIAKDLSKDSVEMSKLTSMIGIGYAIAVNISPAIGGYIEETFHHWQITFALLALFMICLVILLLYKLPETLPKYKRHKLHIKIILSNYYQIISNLRFISFSTTSACALAGMMSYLTIAPYLLEVRIGLSPQNFGYTALVFTVSLIMASLSNKKFVAKYGIVRMLYYSGLIMLFSALVMTFFALFHLLNTWVILLPMMTFILASGIAFSNGGSGAIGCFQDKAGSASSLYSCLQMLGGMAGSFLITKFSHENQMGLCILLILYATIVLGLVQFLNIKRKL